MQKSHDITKKELMEIVIVTLVLGIGLFAYDLIDAKTNFDGSIERNEAGSGKVSKELELNYGDKSESYTVSVSEKGLTDKEVEETLEKAKAEIRETFLGENKSADNVQYDLVVKESYQEGLVEAIWMFSEYSVMYSDGTVLQERVEEDVPMYADIELTCQDVTEVYTLNFVVRPLDTTSERGRQIAIKKAIEAADESTKTEDTFVLPDKADDLKLTWKKHINFRGLELAALGIIAAGAMWLGKKEDKKKAKKLIFLEKERDYPLIVSELSILMAAGMSLRKALERITKRYLKKKERKPGYVSAGYEEMLITYRQIIDGMGEMQALESLSLRCEQKDYRKLSLMLMQNIKKGSKDLTYALEKEEVVAFEMRKQRAMRLGEEASTKMLIPMAGMLMIVMVVLIVPAFMQMNI